MWTRALLLGAIGLASGSVVGCAQERPPINRVQADALAKSFFVGADLKNAGDDPEFYMRGTVVDVGYGAAQDGLFTSTYAQPITRIKWEITEDLLNARLSYERIEGSDGKGNQVDGLVKKKTNDGQIVASYKIKTHFDIRRSYNPTTGEEQNVVEENSSDRPWYQREYFRVDWSQNLATDAYDYDTLTSLGWIGGVEYSPLAYTVLDPNAEDAPHFDAEQGYFDVTNKAFAKPAVIDISALGWGLDKIPACYLPGDFAGGSQPTGDCNPVEITIRQSFRKVVDKDYEPVDYDGYRFQAFGIFTTDRVGYDRDYGMNDAQWHRFASRYNIWERSHFYSDPEKMTGAIACATKATTEDPTGDPNADPNRDTDKDGTADECKDAGPGSRCDVFSKKCTLPYQQRKAVTIPWYVNGASTTIINSLQEQIANAKGDAEKKALEAQLKAELDKGEDLFEATNWGVEEWDLAMKTAIQTARQVECKKTGGTDCAAKFPMWVGQQEDIDEAVAMSRALDLCRRKAALGSTDPTSQDDSDKLEAARKAGWTAQSCVDEVVKAADALAQQRQDPSDVSANAMKTVVPMDPVIVLCHNPVIQSDHPACGPLGLSPRLGDIRYNTVLNIDKPQSPSAWGIMVDADDPLTGEKVAASINIWTHITDIAGRILIDTIEYMNGDLKTADITEGDYIVNWAKAAQLGQASSGPTMTKAQLDMRVAAATKLDAKTFQATVKPENLPASVAQSVRQFNNEQVKDVALSNAVASPSAYEAAARMRQVRGTPTEAQLINKPMLQLAGLNTGVVPSGAMLDQASPLALNNPRIALQLRQMRENAMAARGACILNEAPEASSLAGLADALNRKFPAGQGETASAKKARYDAMMRFIRRRYHYAVLSHEMGHSVGLRHNFVSTYASLHFRPQYWQLRTKNGKLANQPCQDAAGDGSTCVGPRYWDPISDEENSQAIWMFQQSTVMDYPGDVSQDMLGLGVYDFAAARMFYGDVTSVYNVQKDGALDKDYLAGGKIGIGILNATDNFGGLAGIQYSVKGGGLASNDPNKQWDAAGNPVNFHYSQLQRYYKLIHDCQPVTPTPPSWWREDVDGKWDALYDGGIVTVDGQATKCRTLPVDYMGWEQLRNPISDAEIGNGFFRAANAIDDATKRVRVPYSFASDNWADLGNTSVFRHDNGADPYEQVMFLTTTQENRHIFDNYRRGRNTFSVRAAADRSYSRYNDKLVGIAGGMAFYASIYKDFATSQGYTFDTLFPYIVEASGLRDNIIAGTVAFDHFTRELSRPEVGAHYRPSDPFDHTLRSAEDPNGNPGQTVLIVPNGSTGYLRDIGFGGHRIENQLSENHGDYDVDYTWNAGSYYDKINTAILLAESEDRFISQSRQDFYDARFRAVGLADIYPEGFRRVIANALTDDRSLLAPHVTAVGANPEIGMTDVNDPTNDDAKKYPKNPIGWTSWWPNEGPTECFPSNGSNVCANYTKDWSGDDGGFKPLDPASKVGIDPQIGFEVQKFLIAWTAAYISANQKAEWIDMMRIYKIGPHAAPSFEGRIEWQDPASGQVYYAKTYGKECLFGTVTLPANTTGMTLAEIEKAKADSCKATGGKWVQKGIAARVLEYANELTAGGYELDTAGYPNNTSDTANLAPGFNAYGRAMVVLQPDGTPVIAGDPTMQKIGSGGSLGGSPVTCDNNVDPACTPLTKYDNHFVMHLDNYKSVPNYLWEIIVGYGLGTPDQLGIYPD
jgi:hypothetical protein